ncbi:MAG TPA: FAD-dependent oxidoreductase [Syntrophorhabdales bacterium]|nr:FAD-dependent oxidoreductase [Syntrophorhabdales bacterium]
MSKHLVFVGGGHAHLTALKNLSSFTKRGHSVTLISASAYHYYSGMGPGMLSGTYHPSEVRFHVKKMAENQGAAFIEDKVVKIDALRRLLFLRSGGNVAYDVVSFNTGSEVPVASIASSERGNIVTVKPVVNLLRAKHAVSEALQKGVTWNYVVIGGGPAGVEVCANLLRLLSVNRGKGKIVLIAGEKLMPGAPEKVRRLAFDSLTGRGVEIVEASFVKMIEQDKVNLTDGSTFDFNLAFVAIGIRPAPMFAESGLPTGPDGGLLVNAYLQSVAHPDMFAGGDCASLEGHTLAKVGVYAVRENPILFHNLKAALEGGEMMRFIPQPHYLLIFNMGDGRGIFWKKNWVWDGRLAFLLKDYIDRRFMKMFQVSGEREEMSDLIK